MPLMRATADWYNGDHEGRVERGQEFETSEYRATELERVGLAVRAISETRKTRVVADEPAPETSSPSPSPENPEPPRKAPAKRKR